jgi:hypothetical protein
MEFLDMIWQTIETAGGNVLVGAIVLIIFAMMLLALMFFLLAVRGIFRWFIRGSWNDVVRSTTRKALK